jgi:hypothetical protein
MRSLTCGIILAFLYTTTHVLIDHGAWGQRFFALLPHPASSHAHGDMAHPDAPHDHDHEGEPAHAHDPYHHQAETHSHCVWSTPADGKSALYFAPSVLAANLGIHPSVALPASLHSPPPVLPGDLALYLQWSVLRI